MWNKPKIYKFWKRFKQYIKKKYEYVQDLLGLYCKMPFPILNQTNTYIHMSGKMFLINKNEYWLTSKLYIKSNGNERCLTFSKDFMWFLGSPKSRPVCTCACNTCTSFEPTKQKVHMKMFMFFEIYQNWPQNSKK